MRLCTTVHNRIRSVLRSYFYVIPGSVLRIVYDLFLTNCTAIVCNDVLKTNFACIRKWLYRSVNDTEKYDRNTEPGIPLKYGDIRSRRPYLAVYGRKRAWAFDLGRLAANCHCISDSNNRINFLRALNETCQPVLMKWNCFYDLPNIVFTCQTNKRWYTYGRIIIFLASILDVVIVVVVWGRPFKPNLLAVSGAICTFKYKGACLEEKGGWLLLLIQCVSYAIISLAMNK